jgi:hypothetical protein
MVRGESHRATYRMHHFQSSRIYETGSSKHTLEYNVATGHLSAWILW